MESSITVREATTDDAARISDLLTALAEEFIVGEFSDEGRRHLLAHFSATEMAERLASTNYQFQVAEIDGTLIGVVGVRERTHLQYLFVNKTHQRAGLARRLWEQARDVKSKALAAMLEAHPDCRVLRRSGELERAKEYCETGLALKEVPEFIRSCLELERRLIEAGDTACHTVGEAE